MQRISVFLALVLLLVSVNVAQRPVRDLEPTVILVSIDGFRYDYLDLYRPKTLRSLSKKGVRAKWMTPSFPTKTFPNHYTVATGLYPSHHGIVANNIYDPTVDRTFTLGNRNEVQDPRWWGGEPIWVTAEKNGIKAGAFFFPGTETTISGFAPTYWQNYDGKIPNEVRVDSVLSWFDYPKERRPQIFTLYFSDVDSAGHRFSPESRETKDAVRRVDSMIKRLYDGLRKRKIEKKVNLIIVSDHGMAPSPGSNYFVLDEVLNPDETERIIWVGELTQVFPKEGRTESVYKKLKDALPKEFAVYLKSEIPERFNYRTNRLIAPIIIVPKPGWYTINKETLAQYKESGRLENTGGRHGYDHEEESMRALFLAHGPAFRRGFVAEPFSNVEVYNLMCKILGIKPAPNDGKLENIAQILK